MKNIHILPTHKPSNLCIDTSCGELNYFTPKGLSTKHTICHHIYITSDEEIIEGDWYLDTTINVVFKNDKIFLNGVGYKKIILTTDQDLIKDGVQSIDDEFLEWFVQNPSCEEVEVKKEQINNKYGSSYSTITIYKYKIIIPKEEPKQETLEERVGKKAVEYCKKYENTFKYNDIMLAIEFGYQLAQQELYSEEEVENILIEYVKTNPTKPYRVVSWFQQFKKK